MLINQQQSANTQADTKGCSNLRKLLKDKAKSIRQNRFKLNNYPQPGSLAYAPLQKGPSFNNMLHRVTNSMKNQLKKKKKQSRSKSERESLFGTTFMIEKLKPKIWQEEQKQLKNISKNKISSSIPEFVIKSTLPKGFSSSDKKLRHHTQNKMASTLYSQKDKTAPFNYLSKVCKGRSFSRSKKNIKMPTEGSVGLINHQNTGHFDNQFVPLGNLSIPSNLRSQPRSQQLNQQEEHCSTDKQQEDDPLTQVYNKIFINYQNETERKSRYYKTRRNVGFQSGNNSFYNDAKSEQVNISHKYPSNQKKARTKVFSQQKIQSFDLRDPSTNRKNEDLGPWI